MWWIQQKMGNNQFMNISDNECWLTREMADQRLLYWRSRKPGITFRAFFYESS